MRHVIQTYPHVDWAVTAPQAGNNGWPSANAAMNTYIKCSAFNVCTITPEASNFEDDDADGLTYTAMADKDNVRGSQ